MTRSQLSQMLGLRPWLVALATLVIGARESAAEEGHAPLVAAPPKIRVHIEADAPNLGLYTAVLENPLGLSSQLTEPGWHFNVGSELRIDKHVCWAPCDASIDPGNQWFVFGGPNGIRTSKPFRLEDRSGPQTIRVRVGKTWMRTTGIATIVLSSVGLGGSFYLYLFGDIYVPRSAASKNMRVAAEAIGEVSLTSLIAGIVLVFEAKTTFDFDDPKRGATAKARANPFVWTW